MSDSPPPRINQRPRRSGVGLILPLIVLGLLLWWLSDTSGTRTDTLHPGQTIEILPFDTSAGPWIARVTGGSDLGQTELYPCPDFKPAPEKSASTPAHANANANASASADANANGSGTSATPGKPAAAAAAWTDWPQNPKCIAYGGLLGGTMINDRDFIAFYRSEVSDATGLPTQSMGYVYPNVFANRETYRLFTDTDFMPEVFVTVPTALRSPADISASQARPGASATSAAADTPAGGSNPAKSAPATPVHADVPATPAIPATPAHSEAPASAKPESTPSPNPAARPVADPVSQRLPAPGTTAPVAPGATAPGATATGDHDKAPTSPAASPVASPTPVPIATATPANATPATPATSAVAAPRPPAGGSTPQAPPSVLAMHQAAVPTAEPIWCFGRIVSNAPDRHDRIGVLEIDGKTVRMRTISTEQLEITANSFLISAVPTADGVHLFWRQDTDNRLPDHSIYHVIYNGHEFVQQPTLQDVPPGFFTTSLLGDRIFISVLTPSGEKTPVGDDLFHGKYVLKYAFLDPPAAGTAGAQQPTVLHFETANGVGVLDDLFELRAVTRLDGKVSELMAHGYPDGQERIVAIDIPPAAQVSGGWKTHLLLATHSDLPSADLYTVVLMVGMLGVFAVILMVAWLRPWRWFARPPSPLE